MTRSFEAIPTPARADQQFVAQPLTGSELAASSGAEESVELCGVESAQATSAEEIRRTAYDEGVAAGRAEVDVRLRELLCRVREQLSEVLDVEEASR